MDLRFGKFDCGSHGQLTTREIAEKTGLKLRTVQDRVRRGVRGDELMRVKDDHWHVKGTPGYRDNAVRTAGRGTVAVAIKIARMFPNRVPTVKELQEKLGMHRATAYRWRDAFIDEMGVGE